MSFILFSGGAAHGLVQALEEKFRSVSGLTIEGSYGPVGIWRDKILAGEPADMLILSRGLIDGLVSSEYITAEKVFDIGAVKTAVAVRTGDRVPDISNRDELREALTSATDIYFPNPKTATAGIHFANVMTRLGIDVDNDERLHRCVSGADAMDGLATQVGGMPLGCTQITEILPVEGVEAAGMLPGEFELATTYTIGIPNSCREKDAATLLTSLLTSAENAPIRADAGFGL